MDTSQRVCDTCGITHTRTPVVSHRAIFNGKDCTVGLEVLLFLHADSVVSLDAPLQAAGGDSGLIRQ